MTTLEEIAATEKWVKDSNTLDDGEKYRWLTSLAEMREKELKKTELAPASEAEIEKVMDMLMPEYRSIKPKPTPEKSAHDKEIDSLLDKITPWMR